MISVKFIGATKDQVNYHGGDDPREYLEKGKTYLLTKYEVRSWSTTIEVAGFEGKRFNSVCFEGAPEMTRPSRNKESV